MFTDDAVLGFLLALAYLWFAKFLGLWAWEVWSMTRKGYWLDSRSPLRGRYEPKWRHMAGKLPDVKARHVPF